MGALSYWRSNYFGEAICWWPLAWLTRHWSCSNYYTWKVHRRCITLIGEWVSYPDPYPPHHKMTTMMTMSMKGKIFNILQNAWHPKDQFWSKIARQHSDNYLYRSQNPLQIGLYWPRTMLVWFKLSTTELQKLYFKTITLIATQFIYHSWNLIPFPIHFTSL